MTEESSEQDLKENILEELVDQTDGDLKEFLKEYKSWQNRLIKSRKAEAESVARCKTLIAQIETLEEDVSDVFEQKDRKALEIETCRERQADINDKKEKLLSEIASKKKEMKELREKQDLLCLKLDNLENALREENDKKEKEMYQKVEKLAASREVFQSQVNRMWEDNLQLQESLQKLQTQKHAEQKAINDVLRSTKEIDLKIKSETLRNEGYLRSIEDGEIDIATEKKRLEINHKSIDDARKLAKDVEKKLKDTESMLGEDVKILDMFHDRSDKFAKEVETQIMEQGRLTDKLEREKIQVEQTLERKAALSKEHAKVKRKNDLLQKKFEDLEAAFNEVEGQRRTLDEELKESRSKFEALQKVQEVQRKQKLLLFREKTVMCQELNTQKTSEMNIRTEAFMMESTGKSFENELASIKNAKGELKSKISHLRRNLERLDGEIDLKKANAARTLEEIAKEDLEIEKILQSIQASEQSLRKQDNLLDAVRKDRDLYNKMLLEQRAEMEEHRRQFTSITQSIKRVKMELREKDQGFLIEHFNVDQVDKDVLITRSKIEGLKKKVQKAEKLTAQQAKQIEALTQIIAEAEVEEKNQVKLLDSINNEDRLLTQRLVTKNAELRTLYEDLRLLNSLFLKGKSTYEEHVKEIREIRNQTADKHQTLEKIQKQISLHNESEKEIEVKEKRLIALKLKVRAFTDELQKPVNVHRWRSLVDTDPETHDLIQKVHSLNKELISTSNQIATTNKDIIQEEENYIKTAKILERLPGEEAREQLRMYTTSIEDKKGKLKTVNAELRVQRGRVTDLKYELMQLDKHLRLLDIEWIQAQIYKLSQDIDGGCASRLKQIGKTLHREKQKISISQF